MKKITSLSVLALVLAGGFFYWQSGQEQERQQLINKRAGQGKPAVADVEVK